VVTTSTLGTAATTANAASEKPAGEKTGGNDVLEHHPLIPMADIKEHIKTHKE